MRNTVVPVPKRSDVSRPAGTAAALQASGVGAAPLQQPRERGVAVAEPLDGAADSFECANAMWKRPLQLARYLYACYEIIRGMVTMVSY